MNDEAQDQMQLDIEKRRTENDTEVLKIIHAIFKKGHSLTQEDKAFLQARVSYLSKAEYNEYETELNEDLLGNGDPLNDLSRNGLNAKATELGIEDPEKFPNKDSLIDAIKNAQ